MRTLAYNPLAGGLLTGKHRQLDDEPQAGSRFTRHVPRPLLEPRAVPAVERLRGVAKEAGLELLQLALRWVLGRPLVSGVLLGASSHDQLVANLDAVHGPPLDQDTLDACDEVWRTSAASPRPTTGDRHTLNLAGACMEPIPAFQLGDRTYSSIRAAIVSGELAPRQALVDRQLAEQLQVSRTPVREALHRLEADGLVQPRGRAGWEVSDFTEQDVHELFQLRLLLEPVGLDALSKTPDDALVERVATFFDGYDHPVAGEAYEDYVARDRAFHELLVACSGNRRLQRFYAVLGSHIDRGRHFLTGSAEGRADDTLDEHRAVATAVGTATSPERARRCCATCAPARSSWCAS